jgi:hypothetical protein
MVTHLGGTGIVKKPRKMRKSLILAGTAVWEN